MSAPAHEEKSLTLRKQVRARVQQCYANSVKGLAWLPGSVYVEGFCVTDLGMVIEHGWLEHEGDVVDPTLTMRKCFYFPAYRYTGRQVIDILLRNKRMVPLWAHHLRPEDIYAAGSPWANACRAAWAHLGIDLPRLRALSDESEVSHA